MNQNIEAIISVKRSVLFFALLASFLFFSRSGYAQDGLNLPKEIPPSPETQLFEKYGNFPPGAFNGIPKISIPLYTVVDGDLSVPITLNFYAEGAKLTAMNGFVGLNWTIMTGGKISRTIVDQPDDEYGPPTNFYTTDQLNAMTIANRDQILDGWKVEGPNYDTEPDIFSYNFNGHNGKFVLKRDAAKTPMLLPYKPISITPVISGTINAFNATDEKGIKYAFTQSENVSTPEYTCFTAWDCSSMTSPKGRQITFQSQGGPNEFEDIVTYQFGIQDTQNTQGAYTNCGFYSFADILPYYNPGEVDLSDSRQYGPAEPYKISFSGGTVTFVEDPDTKMLKEMQVADNTGKLLKVIGFVIKQEPSSRYILKEVDLFDGQRHLIGSYKMSYYNENGGLPLPGAGDVDYWGFYNGGELGVGQNYLPPWTIQQNPVGFSPVTPGNDSRSLSLASAQTLMLDTLKYPTGGFTTYQYELNQVSYLTPAYYGTQLIGGLRINTIANYASPGSVPEIHTYQYDGGQVDFFPGNVDDYSYSYQGIIPQWTYVGSDGSFVDGGTWYPFRERWYNSEPTYNMTPHGNPEVYTDVTEYIGNGTVNTGKTEYTFDYTAPATTTYQTNPQFDIEGNTVMFKKYLLPFQDWTSGTLQSKTDYVNVNGTYTQVASEGYDYTDYPGDTLRGMKLDRYVKWQTDGCSTTDQSAGETQYNDGYLTMFGGVDAWNYGDYYIVSGDRRLTSKIVLKDNVQQITNYAYDDPVRDQPTQETVNSSTGDNFITQVKYPVDFSGANANCAAMDASHIWASPVENITYKNNTNNFLSSELINYDNQGKVISIATKKGDINNTYDTRILYNAYNGDNPSDVSKPNGPRISYQWGYNNRYPVAECISAPVIDVFYDSFEEGDGNTAAGDAKTGHYSYNGGTTPFSKALSGLDAGSYTLSYWLKSGSTWSLITTPVAVTGTTYTITLNGQIDDVRFYPANAQITTYTYDPLVGMTSSTDAKSEITYFEYDGFQRLINIRDKDKNIIKSYCYNYAGQQSNCFINLPNYYNAAQSGTYTKNNCTTGAGSVVTYTVPANQYTSNISQADADQQALNDVTANGLNYANANGTCTTGSVTVTFNVMTSNVNPTFFVIIDNGQDISGSPQTTAAQYQVNAVVSNVTINTNSTVVFQQTSGYMPVSATLSGSWGTIYGVVSGSTVTFSGVNLGTAQSINLNIN